VTFAPLGTAQRLAGRAGMVNDAVVRLAGTAPDRRAAARAIEVGLRTRLPGAAATVTAIDDERAYRFLYDDIEGDQRLYTIFAFLILGGSAFAAFNLIGRIVEAQRREIGIGMALGLTRPRLAIRPLLVAFQVALLGAAFGVGVGLGMNRLMGSVLKQFFPLPEWHTPFEVATYARGVALGLALPFAAAIVPVARAVRVPPVAAIRTGPHAQARLGGAGLLAWLTVGNSIRQMPVRNVLRAPRRALMTVLAVAAAIGTLVGVVGLVDSFLATIDRGEASVVSGRPDRLSVDLQGFAVRDSPQLHAVTGARGVGEAEPGLDIGGTLRNGRDDVEIVLRLIRFDSALWTPAVTDGRLDTVRAGVVIGEKAAADLGVRVGDALVLRHPRREGAGYRWVESEVPVEAIHDVPYRFLAFMDLHDAAMMNLEGIYNTVSVAPAPGTAVATLQRTLFTTPGVASAQPVTAFVESIRSTINEFLDVLRVVEGAVLVLALLIAFNSAAIGVDERAREHATMFAFGVPLRTTLGNTVVESVLVGAAGTAAGIGLGYAIVGYITRFLLPGTLPDIAVRSAVSSTTVRTAAVLGILAVAVAPLFTSRRMRRMNLPATLRVVE
jgi:putative ABC transport system permease protein